MRVIVGIVIVALLAGLIAWWRLCPQCFVLPHTDAPPPPPPAAAFTVYQHPGMPVTGYRGINTAGDIVGYYQETAEPETAHAILMRGGVATVIDPPSERDRRAFGINDHNVIGLSYDGRHTVMWDGATYTPVIYPGAAGTVVRTLNNRGDVGGEYSFVLTDDTTAFPFLRVDGVFIALEFPSAVRASVRGLNDAGQAVGYTQSADGLRQCFVRAPDGAITTLTRPDAILMMCAGINNHGHIVGAWARADRRLHGFVWRDGAFTDFDVPDAQDTLPIAINDAGDIVGEASFGGRYGDYAFPHRAFFTAAFRAS